MIDYSDTVFAAERLRQKSMLRTQVSDVAPPIEESLSRAPTEERDLVLVIDDSKAMVEVLGDVLQYLGCDVVSAYNGREGLSAFEKNRDRISLVILDMNMPVMNGEEALRGLREIDPGVPVIISSSVSENEARRRCRKHGQDMPSFLGKPYELDQARRLLHSILRA